MRETMRSRSAGGYWPGACANAVAARQQIERRALSRYRIFDTFFMQREEYDSRRSRGTSMINHRQCFVALLIACSTLTRPQAQSAPHAAEHHDYVIDNFRTESG